MGVIILAIFWTLIRLSSLAHWRRRWHPTPVLLPGKSHGQRSLMGCSPWGRKELDMTKWLHFHFHFSLSCIGEENGNQLQCSCLENLRDGGAWWAAIYGVAQSRTRLKQLSSSSSLAHKLIELLKADISDTWKNVMLQKARALWRSYFNHQRAHVISSTLKTISEICFL